MNAEHVQLTDKEKKLLFWASFLSLAAAGMGFSFRVAHGGSYGAQFDLTNLQIGMIFGGSLWPIAVTMIGFSLVLDKTGFKMPMYVAFALQALSAVGTAMAWNYETLLISALCAGLGHGIVEAVINPVCAAVYPKDKTVKLTILHAAWPAGLVFGTLPIIAVDAMGDFSWRIHALWMVIPVVAYAIMYAPCKFPVDERVKAGIPFSAMLKEVGFLTAFLAGGLLVYELGGQFFAFTGTQAPDNWFYMSVLGGGAAIGIIFGLITQSLGKPLFFLLCLMMIPVATAELATDGWIKKLMTPVLETWNVNPAFALVFSAFIMLILRTFAAPILRLASPPTVMAISGLGSAVGLWWLGSGATGAAIFIAFTIYAIGQTYYWPCILGFVSERYPQGGALTLNTVSAVGLLSVGIIGAPVLGVAFDESIHKGTTTQLSDVATAAEKDAGFLWRKHKAIDPAKYDLHQAAKIKPFAATITTTVEGIDAEGLKGIKEAVAEAAKNEKTTKAWADFKVDEATVVAYKGLQKVIGVKDKEKSAANVETIKGKLDDKGDEAVASVMSDGATFGAIDVAAGRDVLKFAAIFPGILIVVFAAVALYFRSRGGYKPIVLEEAVADHEASSVEEAEKMAKDARDEAAEM